MFWFISGQLEALQLVAFDVDASLCSYNPSKLSYPLDLFRLFPGVWHCPSVNSGKHNPQVDSISRCVCKLVEDPLDKIFEPSWPSEENYKILATITRQNFYALVIAASYNPLPSIFMHFFVVDSGDGPIFWLSLSHVCYSGSVIFRRLPILMYFAPTILFAGVKNHWWFHLCNDCIAQKRFTRLHLYANHACTLTRILTNTSFELSFVTTHQLSWYVSTILSFCIDWIETGVAFYKWGYVRQLDIGATAGHM